MFLILLSTGTLAMFLLVLWIVKGGSKRVSAEYELADLHRIDTAAFHNLLSDDEESFLRSSLTASHYGQVRRARVRAVQEYLFWIAENCATLIAMLRWNQRTNEESGRATDSLVQKALQLRLMTLGVWMLLWFDYLLPSLHIRPFGALNRYEQFWRAVDDHLRQRSAALITRDASSY